MWIRVGIFYMKRKCLSIKEDFRNLELGTEYLKVLEVKMELELVHKILLFQKSYNEIPHHWANL
jgi:hypothetical protein